MARLEAFVRPRWQVLFAARAFAGLVVLLLALALLIPIPFSNIVPALVIVRIALAYLEKDGMLLAFSLIAAIAALGLVSVGLWETVRALL